MDLYKERTISLDEHIVFLKKKRTDFSVWKKEHALVVFAGVQLPPTCFSEAQTLSKLWYCFLSNMFQLGYTIDTVRFFFPHETQCFASRDFHTSMWYREAGIEVLYNEQTQASLEADELILPITRAYAADLLCLNEDIILSYKGRYYSSTQRGTPYITKEGEEYTLTMYLYNIIGVTFTKKV